MLSKYRETVMSFLRKGLLPSEIAFAVALGNFVGILPFLGLHTVIAIGLAYLLRLNIVVVFLGTQISNPFSFPFILFISAQIGNLVLKGRLLDLAFTTDLAVLKTYIMPTMIGSIVFGLAVGSLSYVLTLAIARRFRS
ncbi:MAG TPA: DUF2062 domain-containing protein [Thermodesulfovibrionales bacterium]|nr:DUF2062 domain-containing protein [Thermodesulfovibrionales bacterium]